MKKNNKLIVIVGPTSSHKTELAKKINKKFNFPLVNADAFQVYKELNCGTNKMCKEDIKNLPVYLMDCISIYDGWNIKKFQLEANKIINSIYLNNKIPIIVGGSNLYIDALIKKYDLLSSKPRTNKYENLSNDELHKLLLEIDPLEAQKIPINNRRRIIRALQIINDIGICKSKKDNQKNTYFNCLIIYMNVQREVLYKAINDNVIKMIKKGWKKELENLLNKDKNVMKLNALKAIGYQEVYLSIINKCEIDVNLIAQKSRHYAKRQITWCMHQYKDFINYHGIIDDNMLFKKIESFIHD